MSRLCTPSPSFDPLTAVIGVRGTPYPCPDIATLERHIAWLWHRLDHAGPHFPALVWEFRADIDLLLDRRQWLEFEWEIEQHIGLRDAA